MSQTTAKRYDFETGVYRPPSEGGSLSLLVRLTRNCPWNHCTFCGMYKSEKFQVRSVADIKKDIDAMAAIRDDLAALSIQSGQGGKISRHAAVTLIGTHPELNHHQGFAMLYHWLSSGGKTAFLQDANSLVMKTGHLVAVLEYLRRTFPSIVRVTSYARSKTLVQKSLEDLKAIGRAGLDRLHVGLESGDDAVLKKIRKGATAEIHIKGGKKALDAGFQLSEYWMPGLGGRARWEQHAENTARVLSPVSGVVTAVNPGVRKDGTQAAQNPYAGGWVLRIHATDLRTDLKNLLIGSETEKFLEEEVAEVYRAVEDVAGPLAADGGFLGKDIYGSLPELGWDKLAKKFLRS